MSIDLGYKKTICLVRLRSSEKYTKPLSTICDSMYYCYKRFMGNHPEYDYRFFSISLDGTVPKKNIKDIIESDILIIPSEAEFTFHIKGRTMNFVKQRTDEVLNQIRKVVDGKKIILLQSDRADNVELYTKKVFPNNDVKISSIDEDDFKTGLHTLKYYFLKEYQNFNYKKSLDFAYWGTSKKKKVSYNDDSGEISGDIRHEVLRDIKKLKLNSCFIGTFDGFKRDIKFSKKMSDITPHIAKSNSTLCFNWPDFDKYLTSRYHEAMAYNVIPLVWKNYDCNNRLVATEWQRCSNYEDVKNKCLELRYEDIFKEKLSLIKNNYLSKIGDTYYYVNQFDKLLNGEVNV